MRVNDLNFHVIDEGSGQAVLLLHGFPDSSYLWRNQIPALTDAGFRVIAPDLRGFGESDKPQPVEDYGFLTLLSDVTGILDALGVERVRVVGHDWGAFLAWMLAIFHPARVERLAVLSVGHPIAFRKLGMEQREKSWYMLLFQFEEAEQLIQANDWAMLRALFRDRGDVERYIQTFSQPGALTAALNWYRANSHPRTWLHPLPEPPPVTCPVLGIWSEGDHHLLEAGMTASAGYVSGPWRYERIEKAGHWIPVDAPDELNRLLLEFLP